MAGFLHWPVSLVPNATEELFQKEREREKEETASEQREFSYHNIRAEEFALSVFHCLQMFPQSDSVTSVLLLLLL